MDGYVPRAIASRGSRERGGARRANRSSSSCAPLESGEWCYTAEDRVCKEVNLTTANYVYVYSCTMVLLSVTRIIPRSRTARHAPGPTPTPTCKFEIVKESVHRAPARAWARDGGSPPLPSFADAWQRDGCLDLVWTAAAAATATAYQSVQLC